MKNKRFVTFAAAAMFLAVSVMLPFHAQGADRLLEIQKKIEKRLAAKEPVDGILMQAVRDGLSVENAVTMLIVSGADPQTVVYSAITQGLSAGPTVKAALNAGAPVNTVVNAALKAGGDKKDIIDGATGAGVSASVVSSAIAASDKGPDAPTLLGFTPPAGPVLSIYTPPPPAISGGGGAAPSTAIASPSQP